MAFQMLFSILFASFLWSSSSSILSDSNPFNLKSWCNQTQFPKLCRHFMSQNLQSFPIRQKSEFRKMVIRVALDQALHAQKKVMWHGCTTKLQNVREQAALADCIELYEDTISRLNSTLNCHNYDGGPRGDGQCTDLDMQTWLSTALTNLDTCRTSSMEVGLDHQHLTVMSNNLVSKLTSNALAINKVMITPIELSHDKHEFPTNLELIGARKTLHEFNNSNLNANVVVAKDGSGHFETIQEAINAASNRKKGKERFVIYVKEGVYNEIVEIGKNVKNIMMIGDGIGKTIVTGSKSVTSGFTTFKSATFAVKGDGFIARDMTFRNTAGPSNGQAVSLLSKSDHSVFYRCSFEGYQDTLYVHSNRQFYRECDIYGTVDFIFGYALVFFQNCNIYPRGNTNTITAQARSDPNQSSGIVIHNSKVVMDANTRDKMNNSEIRTYLGRPWRKYAQTVFLKTYLDDSVDPAGWLEWNANPDTVYYGEYGNTGPGSSTKNRVKWGGYHIIRSSSKASQFTIPNFFGEYSWLLSTNVSFNSGL